MYATHEQTILAMHGVVLADTKRGLLVAVEQGSNRAIHQIGLLKKIRVNIITEVESLAIYSSDPNYTLSV